MFSRSFYDKELQGTYSEGATYIFNSIEYMPEIK